MGTTKLFGSLLVIVVGDFFQMASVMDSYIFKDDCVNYVPLAVNVWTFHFHIHSLTEIMWQQEQEQFCEMLNRLQTGELTKMYKKQKDDPQYVSTA